MKNTIRIEHLRNGDFALSEEGMKVGTIWGKRIVNLKTDAQWIPPYPGLKVEISKEFPNPLIQIPKAHGQRLNLIEDENHMVSI